MLSYEEIIKTLRYCSEHQNDCDGCPLKDVDIPPFFATQCGLYAMSMAADAMEILMKKFPGFAYWTILEESETHTLCECSHCKDVVLMHGEGYLTKYCPTCGWSMEENARHL